MYVLIINIVIKILVLKPFLVVSSHLNEIPHTSIKFNTNFTDILMYLYEYSHYIFVTTSHFYNCTD